jgi:hypothetical protein
MIPPVSVEMSVRPAQLTSNLSPPQLHNLGHLVDINLSYVVDCTQYSDSRSPLAIMDSFGLMKEFLMHHGSGCLPDIGIL